MKWDLDAPCATCPYRREVKKALWAEVEYKNLINHDSDPLTGRVFGCHSYGKEAPAEQRPCVGWLLDQKRRRTPAIQLRLALMRSPEACSMYERISDEGLDLYASIGEMKAANYPEQEGDCRQCGFPLSEGVPTEEPDGFCCDSCKELYDKQLGGEE